MQSTASDFILEPSSFEEIQHNDALAADMSATCPVCGGDSRVHAHHKQATRTEPCRFLCVQGWCVSCQLAFDVATVQLVLS